MTFDVATVQCNECRENIHGGSYVYCYACYNTRGQVFQKLKRALSSNAFAGTAYQEVIGKNAPLSDSCAARQAAWNGIVAYNKQLLKHFKIELPPHPLDD